MQDPTSLLADALNIAWSHRRTDALRSWARLKLFHSITYAPFCLDIHQWNHFPIHLSLQLFIHPSFISPFIHSFSCIFVYPSICAIHAWVGPFIHLNLRIITHTVQRCILSIHLFEISWQASQGWWLAKGVTKGINKHDARLFGCAF